MSLRAEGNLIIQVGRVVYAALCPGGKDLLACGATQVIAAKNMNIDDTSRSNTARWVGLDVRTKCRSDVSLPAVGHKCSQLYSSQLMCARSPKNSYRCVDVHVRPGPLQLGASGPGKWRKTFCSDILDGLCPLRPAAGSQVSFHVRARALVSPAYAFGNA